MEKKQSIDKIDDQSIVKPTDLSDNSQIAIADEVVARIVNKEESFMTKYFPSKEDKARREKDIELIKQALGDRNKMYKILRETQVKNFTLAANDFLTKQMTKSSSFLIAQLSTTINDAIEKIDIETERFYETLQKKQDRADNWQGSLKEKIKSETVKEIDKLSDQFSDLKENLMNDLIKIREKLIK